MQISRPKKLYSIAATAALLAGIGAASLASPETMSFIDNDVPGVGFNRQCSFGDPLCSEIRSREMRVGSDWQVRTYYDSDATQKKQIIFGLIGMMLIGVPSFSLAYWFSKKEVISSGNELESPN